MNMVEGLEKSRKNLHAYVLITPETNIAVKLLIDCREAVSVPEGNKYLFARLNADTPLSGITSLREVCQKCPDLLCPERITSTNLRKYVATVSQVSRMLTAVECGYINSWKDRPMSEINLDDLPYPASDYEGDEEKEDNEAGDEEREDKDDMDKAKTFKQNRTVDDENDDNDYKDGDDDDTYCEKITHLPETKRGMKKRWTEEENQIFSKNFSEEIRLKKMPLASKLQKAKAELKNRTVMQIRTKINNIILEKQKFVLYPFTS